MLIYLAGQIVDWEEGHLWRSTVSQIAHDNGHAVHNPLAFTDISNEHSGGNRELIMARNIKLLKDSDLLIVKWNEKAHSVGTVYEMAVAKQHGIPIVVFASTPSMAADLDNDPYMMHLHDMQTVQSFTIDNLKDVIEHFTECPEEWHAKYDTSPVKGDKWQGYRPSPF